jgi:hypothetical protein
VLLDVLWFGQLDGSGVLEILFLRVGGGGCLVGLIYSRVVIGVECVIVRDVEREDTCVVTGAVSWGVIEGMEGRVPIQRHRGDRRVHE